MGTRAQLAAQVKDLQAKLATCEATSSALQTQVAGLQAELAAERGVGVALSDQNEQLRTDLAAATAEVARLQAIIDATPPPAPAGPDLQSRLQQLQ